LLRRAGVRLATRPFAIAGIVAGGLRSSITSRGKKKKDEEREPRSRSGSGRLPVTRFNHPVSPHRVWDTVWFGLDDVKQIRTLVPGATVNDVAIAIVGGAMRRYLEDKGELPTTSLVTLMPISVRPTMAQRGPSEDASPAAGGNQFSMTAVPMATDIDDPIERLAEIHRNTLAAKAGAVDARSLTQISEAVPGALLGTVQRAVTRLGNRAGLAMGVHTITTNVPGSQTPLYFCGARAVRMAGMAPVGEGIGLINGLGSYDGLMNFTFTADREMMPDPDVYSACMKDAFAELRALLPQPNGGPRSETQHSKPG
jgi:WS/DGAT/MGAT family acyltransferase